MYKLCIYTAYAYTTYTIMLTYTNTPPLSLPLYKMHPAGAA